MRVKATELVSAANRLGPGDAIVTPLTAVGVLVRGFSTELEAVPPRVSRRVLMADTAAVKVIGVLEASFSVKPVAVELICSSAHAVRVFLVQCIPAAALYLIQLVSND